MRITNNYYLLLILVVAGCASVSVPDAEFCVDAGPNGARCFHWLAEGKDRNIPKDVWDHISFEPNADERFGQVCTPPETFAKVKGVIEKLCAQTKNCSYSKTAEALMAKIKSLSPR